MTDQYGAEELYDDDGHKFIRPLQPGYADKGGHSKRHEHTYQQKEIDKQHRKKHRSIRSIG